MKKFSVILLIFILCLTTVVSAASSGFDSYADPSGNINIVNKEIPSNKNVFYGNDVYIDTKFDSLLVIFGGKVTIKGEYDGDVFIFGGDVETDGVFNKNVYVFSSNTKLNGTFMQTVYSFSNSFVTTGAEINQDFCMFSNMTTLSKEFSVNRDVFAFSNRIDILGNIGRNLNYYGSILDLGGKVKGDVVTYVDQLNIKDSAELEGSIKYHSLENQANISEKAKLKQNPDFVQIVTNTEESGSSLFSFIGQIAAVIVIWFLIKTLFPRFFNNSETLLNKKFLEALAFGAGSFILIIILSILGFMISPPLVVMLASGFLSLTMAATYISLTVLSVSIAKHFNSKNNLGYFISIFLAALLYTIVRIFVPSTSIIFSLILTVLGIGFIFSNLLQTRRNYLEEERKKPPTNLENFN